MALIVYLFVVLLIHIWATDQMGWTLLGFIVALLLAGVIVLRFIRLWRQTPD